MIEKTGIIGGLDLPEKAQHLRRSITWAADNWTNLL